ncbi:MAG: hypothetical protein ACOX4H_10400 [Bacillota bacterium]|jgi:uncharacterized Tic20 family protein
MKTKKEKQKLLYRISVLYFFIMSFILICPPITKLFDRNDIWVGIMPLSQFYILFFTSMIIVGLVVTYLIDAKLSGGDDNE